MDIEKQKLQARVAELSSETLRLTHTVTDLTAKLNRMMALPENTAQHAPCYYDTDRNRRIVADRRVVAVAGDDPASPITPKHIERIKDLLLSPVTDDDARTARDLLQSLHFDLSMAAPAAPSVDRNSVLEEVAAIADRFSTLYTAPDVGYDNGYTMAAKRIAEEIRALKSAAPHQVDAVQAVPEYVRKQTLLKALTFDQFVQYGRDHGANIVGGMPWSFQYAGYPVSHENDKRYLIGMPNGTTKDFTPDQMLVTFSDGCVDIEPAAEWFEHYMPYPAAALASPSPAVPTVPQSPYAKVLEKLLSTQPVPRMTDEPLETWAFRALTEALAGQAAQGAVPEGWKLVPLVPTHEMVRAACDAMGATQSVMRAIEAAPDYFAQPTDTTAGE